MTASVTIKCECTDGKTIEALEKMIASRSDLLGETTKDAVIATAINVLVSLRSGTRDAKRNRKGVSARVTHMPGLRPSFTTGRVRCLRTVGGSRYDVRRVRWLTNGLPDRQLNVYRVEPEHVKVQPYYVVCESEDIALEFEKKAASHRIDNYGTLAKWALGVAMNKLSTRNVQDGVSSLAANAGSRLATVSTYGGTGPSGEFGVSVCDDLDYSYSALVHGAAEMDSAMQKAANKTAGLINRHLSSVGDFNSKVVTPFPEIKRRSA